jgi:hypothetical protein
LQQALPEYERNGIRVFAMAYDPPETMAKFAAKYGITYPLLGDKGSEVLRKLGLVNPDFPAGHAAHGVAYPGWFLVDEKGIVSDRRFYVDYKVRDVPLGVLLSEFPLAPGKRPGAVVKEGKRLRATAWLDSPTFRSGQVIGLNVEIEIEDGWHTYGEPIPEGFFATTVTVEPREGMTANVLPMPNPQPFKVEGLDEQFFVYAGRMPVRAELTFLGAKENLMLKATLSYQACNEANCLPPSRLEFELPIKLLPHVAAPN